MDSSPLLVSVTRRFVEEVLEKFLTDPDLVSRVAMSSHELLENAAKYAREGTAELTVGLECNPEGTDGNLTLQLSNSTTAAHIDRLKRTFHELDSCEDSLAHYLTLMRRNARQKEISGLGLARIRVEGEMGLALAVDGETAVIRARTAVRPGDLA